MRETVRWLNDLALVLGWAVIGSALFFAFLGITHWFGRRWDQGFPRTRARRFR
jgi:hypothetical protein